MNNKATLGLVAAIIILVGAYVLFNKPAAAPAIAPAVATSTDAAATTSPVSTKPLPASPATGAPAITVKPAAVVPVVFVAAFDRASLTSSAARPLLTGTTNVTTVSVVLDDQNGKGMAGSSDIAAVNGHWSYSAPQLLTPGVYRVHLFFAGNKEIVEHLTVTAP
jgi:hypothetical protein